MAPSAKVKSAFKAMKAIGISEAKIKPVLKKLLKVFDNNWAAIEEENYRVLADAIFENEETETAEKENNKKKPENVERGEATEAVVVWQGGPMQDETMQEEPERPLKRLRLKHQAQGAGSNGQPSPTSGFGALKIPKPEPGERDTSPSQRAQIITRSPQCRNKGKQPVSSHNTGASTGSVHPSDQPSQPLKLKESKAGPGTASYGKQKQPQMIALIKPKDEPFTDDVVSIEPLAVVLPDRTKNKAPSKPANQVGSPGIVNGLDIGMESMASTEQEKQLQEVDVSDRAPAKLNIASSTLGKVQISLTCNLGSEVHEMHGTVLEAVLKKLTDDCLKTYRITDPDFSVKKLMKQVCDSVEELGKNCDGAPGQEFQAIDNNGSSITPYSSLNGESSEDVAVTTERILADNSNSPLPSKSPDIRMQPEQNAYEDNSSERDATLEMNHNSIVVAHPDDTSVQPEQNASEDNSSERDAIVEMNLNSIVVAHPDDTSDITRGRESVGVSLEKFNCEFPPSFHYISTNVISDNADVKFSLAQIGDQDCCLSCHADCLPLSSSCNCAQHNGGESPYTADCLLREQFLDEYVSMVRNPQKHDLVFCKECPLERLKNEDMLDSCKGHLKRKFIKECCTICGCSQYCGNRVVQRGLRCNLQVFWTPEGKGWGLRALDNLPKGVFVCEFIGEILTTMELHKRNMSRSNDQHSYSLLLDTDWGTRALKEEEFLCLDATFYGNVARFINHRCTDANLVEIPVQLETPSLHYYHVALFTTRNVNALEELTWDYGVDFDDNELHIKTFRCLCGSQFCRNMKRSSRSRSASALTLQ